MQRILPADIDKYYVFPDKAGKSRFAGIGNDINNMQI
jgi:hypothetical protein